MSFGLHETFHIRDGWLHKGLIAVQRNPGVFLDPGAPEELGLGVNMVASLRFWMRATGLTAEESESGGKGRGGRRVQRLTLFGRLVLEADPYFEQDSTLWLLHYHLAGRPEPASAWYWLFNHSTRRTFDKTTFVQDLAAWARGPSGESPSLRSLESDFDCLVRTYLRSGRTTSPEDSLDCPLSVLGLLAPDSDQKRYRLVRPDLSRLDPLVVLYAMRQWQDQKYGGKRDVEFVDVLRAPGNAGRVFNLDASGLLELLGRLAAERPNLAVRHVRTAGLNLLTLPGASAEELLRGLFPLGGTPWGEGKPW